MVRTQKADPVGDELGRQAAYGDEVTGLRAVLSGGSALVAGLSGTRAGAGSPSSGVVRSAVWPSVPSIAVAWVRAASTSSPSGSSEVCGGCGAGALRRTGSVPRAVEFLRPPQLCLLFYVSTRRACTAAGSRTAAGGTTALAGAGTRGGCTASNGSGAASPRGRSCDGAGTVASVTEDTDRWAGIRPASSGPVCVDA
ncbi:hypothetical protein GCM10010302_40900 [Streptomyces polychromogenes]|uniref:Uncharacterized protein n=1 Tax=Streptomyces polychromogenes TaxID=67342 RepID=A0ABN0VGL5_9ACTN